MTQQANRLSKAPIPQEQDASNTMQAEHFSRFAGVKQAALKGAKILGLAASAGAAFAAAESYSPHMPVSSKITDSLISVNKDLLETGEAALAAGAVIGGAIIVGSRRNDRLKAQLKSTDQSPWIRRGGIGLTALFMATTGEGSALAHAISNESNQAVTTLATGVDPTNPSSTLFIIRQKNALATDAAEIEATAANHIEKQIQTDKGVSVHDDLVLGYVGNPNSSSNPANSPVIIEPARVVKQQFGVDLAYPKNEPAVDREPGAITNDQLGVPLGGNFDVQGVQVKDVKNLDIYPGLDRSMAIGSFEEMTGVRNVTDGLNYNDIVTSGVSKATLESILKSDKLPYYVVTEKQYEKMFSEFWLESIAPPEMQLIGYLGIASLAGLAFVRRTDIQSRLSLISNVSLASGPSMARFKQAEFLRLGKDSLTAAAISGPFQLLLTAATNSSQYGVAEKFDFSSYGAGYESAVVAGLVGAVISCRYISKLNIVQSRGR